MNPILFDKSFEDQDFSNQKLLAKEYDNCTFVNCNFTKTNMSGVTFLECTFDTCKFESVLIKHTSLQEIVFKDCKLLGIDFSLCNDFMFSVEFDHCNLDLTSFFNLKMKNTIFSNCSIKQADFTKSDLTNSVFNDCDLYRSTFQNTILNAVDFRTAKNYTIDPEINMLKKAKFTSSGLYGLLSKYDIVIE
ncbi:pentapeptide repeat-containing protein [Aquimarina algicola]|uniref:Pentapeptide repeat-containing protein n=1 Tax=Aquimarina algicola TaxID=2589995 RepID=A0A504JDG5_9FLAO|nr:pentapeptide repeat-containing protein [Aquimarina algicola]TPN88754.1 pentapeptide repeat-containing protein [Aquimarina algicola]